MSRDGVTPVPTFNYEDIVHVEENESETDEVNSKSKPVEDLMNEIIKKSISNDETKKTSLETAVENYNEKYIASVVGILVQFAVTSQNKEEIKLVQDHLFDVLYKVIQLIVSKKSSSNNEKMVEMFWPLMGHQFVDNRFHGRTTLLWICEQTDLSFIELILNKYKQGVTEKENATQLPDINAHDDMGECILEYLMKNRQSKKEQPATTLACWIKTVELLKQELVHEYRNSKQRKLWFSLIRYNQIHILKYEMECAGLLKFQTSTNAVESKESFNLQNEAFKSRNQCNALHLVCQYSSLKFFKTLINDVLFDELLHETCNSNSCLHFVCKNKRKEICNCDETCDKMIAKCNFDFIKEHIKKCQKENSGSHHKKQCMNFQEKDSDSNSAFVLMQRNFVFSKECNDLEFLDLEETLLLLDETKFTSQQQADMYFQEQFQLSEFARNHSVEKTSLEIWQKAFYTDDGQLLKYYISSKYYTFSSEPDFLETFLQSEKHHNYLADHLTCIKNNYEINCNKINLLSIAVESKKINLIKVLLLCSQTELIPNCVRVIHRCQEIKLVEGAQNDIIDTIIDFSLTVLQNALNQLYSNVNYDQRIRIFRYLYGLMTPVVEQQMQVEASCYDKLLRRDIKKTGPFYYSFSLKETNQRTICEFLQEIVIMEESKRLSQSAAKFQKVFALPCMIHMQNWLWNGGHYKDDENIEYWSLKILNCGRKKHIEEGSEAKIDNYSRTTRIRLLVFILLDVILLILYALYLLVFKMCEGGYTNCALWVGLYELFLVIVWLISVVQEVRDVRSIIKLTKTINKKIRFKCRRNQWLSFINFVDVVFIIIFTIVIILRNLYYGNANSSNFYPGKEITTNVYQSTFWVRCLLGCAFVLACYRRLQHFCWLYAPLGVLYITFHKLMVQDVLPFLVILVVNVMSFGVLFNVLLTPGSMGFYPNGTIAKQHNYISLLNVYSRPLLAAFGELQMDDLSKCYSLDNPHGNTAFAPTMHYESMDECTYPTGTFIYVYIMIFFYLIIVNLTLFNHLIARFSLTVTRYNEEAKIIFSWQTYLAMPALALEKCELNFLFMYGNTHMPKNEDKKDNPRASNSKHNNKKKFDLHPASIIRKPTFKRKNAFNEFEDDEVENFEDKSKQKHLKSNKVYPSIGDYNNKPKEDYLHKPDKYCKTYTNYRTFLVHQAKSFSGNRLSFNKPVYECDKDVAKAIDNLQSYLMDNIATIETTINKDLAEFQNTFTRSTVEQSTTLNSQTKKTSMNPIVVPEKLSLQDDKIAELLQNKISNLEKNIDSKLEIMNSALNNQMNNFMNEIRDVMLKTKL